MIETITTLEQWRAWAAEGTWTLLPYARKVKAGAVMLPEDWAQAWKRANPYSFVLESGKGGRYTFLGLEPVSVIRGKGEEAVVLDLAFGATLSRSSSLVDTNSHIMASESTPSGSIASGTAETKLQGKPLELLQAWMAPYRSPALPGLPKFCGGAVGFLAYDVVRSLERLPQLAKDDLGLDDYVWMRVEELWVIDQELGDVYCIVHRACPGIGDLPRERGAGQTADEGMRASDAELAVLYEEAERRAEQMEQRWAEIVQLGAEAAEVAVAGRAGGEGSGKRPGQPGRDQPSSVQTVGAQLASAHPANAQPANAQSANTQPANAQPAIVHPVGAHPGPDPLEADLGAAGASMTQEAFEAAVTRVQDYIAAGDVFQVNLSLRHTFPMQGTPEGVYEQLRRLNPSPYMGLLRFPDFQLVSASPELLVKVEQGRVSTRPIAGTRRRGRTPEEDRKMEEELLTNEKEQAEHIMLVDLLRNDLGRVADYGSVRASELFAIERYSHVMHLVSEVEARLAPDRTVYDAIAAVFPGGTITGAPKVRTMEIIEELEPVTRGPYTGAMGWIDYNGNMELNIIIRTLVVKDGVGYIQAGAGIVIDSVPYREFRECHNKAKAVALAVRRSENRPGKAGDRR
ncbi:anthranilate synthase component I family protein [Paenibacillus macerans]|uniref:anthranilate synthase component I family protein n=1 Tax=Paenibacillus macerans TaxID=44252 RepID=UPI0020408FDE|nr:anthranilate synthase component I family protein [Paenibacillus macerans]MCM3703927.1 anthranilate synthase component I family protein [Paenibacillus macerans]